MTDHAHTASPAIVKRLKRANGHMNSIIEMIESGRSCLAVAQQLHAVEKAIQQAKKTLIHDHLDLCLADVVNESPGVQRHAFAEFKEVTKYL